MLASEQAEIINAFVDIPDAGNEDKPRKTVASPIDFNRVPTQPKSACPELGADTIEILKELQQKSK